MQSVLQPARAGGATPAARRRCSTATSRSTSPPQTLDYDGDGTPGTYDRPARLWQGDTTIQGERIVLDERRGDLSASGGVQSTLALTRAHAPPPAGGARGTIARGEPSSATTTPPARPPTPRPRG